MFIYTFISQTRGLIKTYILCLYFTFHRALSIYDDSLIIVKFEFQRALRRKTSL
jgi:hypothetical protein